MVKNPKGNPATLKSWTKTPEGLRICKPLRLTLPAALADRWEEMARSERETLVAQALETFSTEQDGTCQ